jgi:hypothetical protein
MKPEIDFGSLLEINGNLKYSMSALTGCVKNHVAVQHRAESAESRQANAASLHPVYAQLKIDPRPQHYG